MITVSIIIHVKVDRRLNVTNKFKYQRRLSSRLAIVMFRGTPCTIVFSKSEFFHCFLETRNASDKAFKGTAGIGIFAWRVTRNYMYSKGD